MFVLRRPLLTLYWAKIFGESVSTSNKSHISGKRNQPVISVWGTIPVLESNKMCGQYTVLFYGQYAVCIDTTVQGSTDFSKSLDGTSKFLAPVR